MNEFKISWSRTEYMNVDLAIIKKKYMEQLKIKNKEVPKKRLYLLLRIDNSYGK